MIQFNYDALEELIRGEKLTYVQVAKLIGKNEKTISKWAKCKNLKEINFTVNDLIIICNKFNRSINDFFIEEKTYSSGYEILNNFRNEYYLFMKYVAKLQNDLLLAQQESADNNVETELIKTQYLTIEQRIQQLEQNMKENIYIKSSNNKYIETEQYR